MTKPKPHLRRLNGQERHSHFKASPRPCEGCPGEVRLRETAVILYRDDETPQFWHLNCLPKAVKEFFQQTIGGQLCVKLSKH